ncbi:hypothetical protein ACVWXP_003310 [Bradyrhizobium sp. USDA 4463]
MGDIVSESTGDFISVRLGDFVGIRSLDRPHGTMAVPHEAVAAVGKLQVLHPGAKRLGFHLDSLRKKGGDRKSHRIDAHQARKLDRDRLVFIDETWASTNMARTHGRCQRGERLQAAVPRGHWKTTTYVAALTTRGIIAP